MKQDVIRSYENYREEERLTTDNSRRIEFLTTVRAFNELFPERGKLLDCAAGVGIYAFYYAEKGWQVTATDLTPRHVELIRKGLQGKPYTMETAVADATDLSCFANESFDIVLNMGPFYHLTEESQRNTCLSECLRVLKPGGLLATAYISRYFVFPYVATTDARLLNKALAGQLMRTGTLRQGDENCFWTDNFFATAEEMKVLYEKAGLAIVDHFAQDGISPMLKDKVNGMDASQFEVWCDYHYAVCREKSLIGASNHAVIVGKKEA